MKNKIAIFLIIPLIFLTNLTEAVSLDKNNYNIEVAGKKVAEKEQEIGAIRDSGKYYGETLDVNERVGYTLIFSEGTRSSNIIAKLPDYTKIEIIETVPYGWFKVKLEDGQIGYVESIRIRTKEIPNYSVDVDREKETLIYNIEKQKLTIYKKGKVILESKGSSGIDEEYTPLGVFKINKGISGKWDYSPLFNQGYMYWTSFYDAAYLIHSIPFSEDKKVITEEAKMLGEKASHGCIRLPIPVAKYINEVVEDGAVLVIE